MFSRFVPIAMLRVRTYDKPWFDDDSRRAFDTNQAANRAWGISRIHDNWDSFVVSRLTA